MAKTVSIYICSECGHKHNSFGPKCKNCGEQFTLESHEVERSASGKAGTGNASGGGGSSSGAGLKTSGAVTPVKKASTIEELNDKPISRTETGIGELDRVLGGGFVEGEVLLFAASPGAGKSTLSMSIADSFANMGNNVLYVSGEESENQIALRAKRMGATSPLIKIVNETTVENILGHVENEKPGLLIIDSLQTMASSELSGSMGSVQQSKEAASTFTMLAKREGIITILISQVTKE